MSEISLNNHTPILPLMVVRKSALSGTGVTLPGSLVGSATATTITTAAELGTIPTPCHPEAMPGPWSRVFVTLHITRRRHL